jgi:hypothetical protein
MNDQDFIGLSVQDVLESCQAHGIDCRIAMVDGEPRFLTEDLRYDRLNFTIENGKVISVAKY